MLLKYCNVADNNTVQWKWMCAGLRFWTLLPSAVRSKFTYQNTYHYNAEKGNIPLTSLTHVLNTKYLTYMSDWIKLYRPCFTSNDTYTTKWSYCKFDILWSDMTISFQRFPIFIDKHWGWKAHSSTVTIFSTYQFANKIKILNWPMADVSLMIFRIVYLDANTMIRQLPNILTIIYEAAWEIRDWDFYKHVGPQKHSLVTSLDLLRMHSRLREITSVTKTVTNICFRWHKQEGSSPIDTKKTDTQWRDKNHSLATFPDLLHWKQNRPSAVTSMTQSQISASDDHDKQEGSWMADTISISEFFNGEHQSSFHGK